MIGMQIIHKERDWRWIKALILYGVFCLFLGFLKEPIWWISASCLGLLMSLWALFLSFRWPEQHPKPAVPTTALLFFIALIITGAILNWFFLTSLPDEKLQVPKLSQRYLHPEGLFQIKGPSSWLITPLSSAPQTGVRIEPASRENYMGALQIFVWVRQLEKKPASLTDFIEKMANSLKDPTRGLHKKKYFEFTTKQVDLIRGGKGVLSVLDVKKLWVPMRQVTLYGVKNDTYLCSVSVTGLSAHMSLAKVLCLGIFETIRITAVTN